MRNVRDIVQRLFKIFALLLLAPLLPYLLYSSGEGRLLPVYLYLILLTAAASSCAIFVILFRSRIAFRSAVMLGVPLSYAIFVAAVLSTAGFSGNLPETLMWLPVMVLFGVPVMLPLVLLAMWAARQFESSRRRRNS